MAARAEELRQQRKQVGREFKDRIKQWEAVIESQIAQSTAAAAAAAADADAEESPAAAAGGTPPPATIARAQHSAAAH